MYIDVQNANLIEKMDMRDQMGLLRWASCLERGGRSGCLPSQPPKWTRIDNFYVHLGRPLELPKIKGQTVTTINLIFHTGYGLSLVITGTRTATKTMVLLVTPYLQTTGTFWHKNVVEACVFAISCSF